MNDQDIVYRLKKRAEIRRSIPTRKSVQANEPDRIADLLEEAALEMERLRTLASNEHLCLAATCELSSDQGRKLEEAAKAIEDWKMAEGDVGKRLDLVRDQLKNCHKILIACANNGCAICTGGISVGMPLGGGEDYTSAREWDGSNGGSPMTLGTEGDKP